MSNRESFAQALKRFADPQKREEYFRFYSDDILLHGYQGIEPGLASVKQFYYAFWKIFPDAQVIVQDLIGEGDTLVARYTITGTMHQAFMGVAAAGQRIELPGISILHFRNGRCFERWTCSDSLVLLNQIGAPVVGAPR
jgi:predicted ester cyclase